MPYKEASNQGLHCLPLSLAVLGATSCKMELYNLQDKYYKELTLILLFMKPLPLQTV